MSVVRCANVYGCISTIVALPLFFGALFIVEYVNSGWEGEKTRYQIWHQKYWWFLLNPIHVHSLLVHHFFNSSILVTCNIPDLGFNGLPSSIRLFIVHPSKTRVNLVLVLNTSVFYGCRVTNSTTADEVSSVSSLICSWLTTGGTSSRQKICSNTRG